MTTNGRDCIQVVAAVVRQDDRYLICRRPLHKRHGGLWEFPGGKLEIGESFLSAAQRELSEELGMSVLCAGEVLFSVVDDGSPFVINFVEVETTGEAKPTEHIDVAWLTSEELTTLPLAPSDRKFVEHICTPPKG